MIQQSHLCVYIQKAWNQYLKKKSASHVHCSTIHNSQDMETAYMSVDGLMDKENVVYNGILLSHKEENPAICNNMDKPKEHYAKWNKPESKNKYCMVSLICGI